MEISVSKTCDVLPGSSCASVLYTIVRMVLAEDETVRAGHGFIIPYKEELHFSDFVFLKMKRALG